jgi:hypothetical protein
VKAEIAQGLAIGVNGHDQLQQMWQCIKPINRIVDTHIQTSGESYEN